MTDETELTPQKFVCMECGSDDVVTEATVVWGVETQDWKLTSGASWPEADYCNCCMEFRDCHHVPMDVKDHAKVAIKKAEAG